MAENKVAYLDGWRGVAVLALLAGHFYPVPGLSLGPLGVNLFFVLSGHLMARLLFLKETPIPLFYKRRVSRIFPAFYFFLVAVVTVFVLLDFDFKWSEFFSAAAVVNNYFHYNPKPTLPFGHVWSICVEEHSYILLSIVAVLGRRKIIRPLIAVGGISVIFASFAIGYWLSIPARRELYFSCLHTEVAGYGIFISAFFLLLVKDRLNPCRRMGWWVYALLLGIGIGSHWWSVPPAAKTAVGVAALALCINLLPSAPDQFKRLLSWMPLRYFGLWSYSIYLWQQPFYLAAHQRLIPFGFALLLSILCGLASYYWLEQPMRLYLNERWNVVRRAGRVAADAQSLANVEI